MSKYTTQLRWIVEQLGEGLPVPDGQEYANAVYKYIGLDKYPIFDESYRVKLNDKIIDHFYFREIGFETAAQFAWYLRRTMNEIMPYYNQLYLSESLVENPLTDRDASWTEEHTLNRDVDTTDDTTSNGTTHMDTSGTSHDRNVYQETPMSLLDNSVWPLISNMDYATTVTYDDGSETGTSDGRSTGKTNSVGTSDLDEEGTRIHTEKGRMTSESDLLLKYRETFLNIDMMVMKNLENLFMSIW